MSDSTDKRKKIEFSAVWREARDIIWARRSRLVLGSVLMIVNRLAGMVMPGSSKWLIDEVVGNQRTDLLVPIAAAVGGAALVQGGSSFALSQVLGVMAQRAITDMRKSVMEHVSRLPVSYFDSTKTGVLISRIMQDAEGIRNLVGTGLVRLLGGFVSATIGLVILFVLNWTLTLVILVILAAFAAAMTIAFKRLRPIFRERSKINAEVTGRLAESLGGIRVVKAYVAERHEAHTFAKGVHRLFRNIATTITGISAITSITTVIVGAVGVTMVLVGGQAMIDERMTLGDFVMYVFFVGLVAMPLIDISQIGTQISEAFAGLDRIREIRRTATEWKEDAQREPLGTIDGAIAFGRGAKSVVFDGLRLSVAGQPVGRRPSQVSMQRRHLPGI